MKPLEFLKDIKIGFTFFMKDGPKSVNEYDMTVVRVGRKYFYCTSPLFSNEFKFELATGDYCRNWGSKPDLFRSKQAYLDDQASVALLRKITKFLYHHPDALSKTQLEAIIVMIGKEEFYGDS